MTILRVLCFCAFVLFSSAIRGDDDISNSIHNAANATTAKTTTTTQSSFCGNPQLTQNMKYICYTKNANGTIVRQVLKFKSRPSLRKSAYNGTKDTKVLIHGYLNSDSTDSIRSLVKTYLSKYDCNILVIDWSSVTCAFLYNYAVDHSSKIGRHAAEMIDFLVRRSPSNTTRFHVVGYSLGAHIAGYLGRKTKTGKLRRITGLDPAEPLIDSHQLYKLTKNDASFVDVIHTSSGMFGHRAIMGHADFLPNNGRSPQPGCKAADSNNFVADIQAAICSHSRAIEYFNESILANDDKFFLSAQCKTYSSFKKGHCNFNHRSHMGETATHGINGTYYLFTGSSYPFALSNNSLPVINDTSTTAPHQSTPLPTKITSAGHHRLMSRLITSNNV